MKTLGAIRDSCNYCQRATPLKRRKGGEGGLGLSAFVLLQATYAGAEVKTPAIYRTLCRKCREFLDDDEVGTRWREQRYARVQVLSPEAARIVRERVKGTRGLAEYEFLTSDPQLSLMMTRRIEHWDSNGRTEIEVVGEFSLMPQKGGRDEASKALAHAEHFWGGVTKVARALAKVTEPAKPARATR